MVAFSSMTGANEEVAPRRIRNVRDLELYIAGEPESGPMRENMLRVYGFDHDLNKNCFFIEQGGKRFEISKNIVYEGTVKEILALLRRWEIERFQIPVITVANRKTLIEDLIENQLNNACDIDGLCFFRCPNCEKHTTIYKESGIPPDGCKLRCDCGQVLLSYEKPETRQEEN